MKKIIGIGIIALCFSGCLTTTQTSEEKAYTAGCLTAVAWSATKDYLPTEVSAGCTVAYDVLNVLYGTNTTSIVDTTISGAIADALGDDATATETALVKMLVNIATAKLSPLITEQADKLTLLASFTKGLNDTLGVSETKGPVVITPEMLAAVKAK